MSYAAHLGRSETREDRVDPRLVERMAATLDLPLPEADLPPLWHWMLFQDWRRPDGLGADGHPRRGGFLPPVDDLPRRMWAGGRLVFTANGLRAEDRVRRVSTILSVSEKSGASGRLVFVTVRHALENGRGAVLSEEQDIVYRGAEGAAVKPAPPAPAFEAAVTRHITPDPVMLFRYSALTGNGHRIHYDHPYATGEEGYPGLVVHGPLQATLLAAAMLDAAPGRRLVRFAFRGQRPCFADRPLAVLARVEGDAARAQTRTMVGRAETRTMVGRAEARTIVGRAETRDATGAACMTADAALA